VAGVVMAEAGRIGSPPVIVIQDATAGIAVKVPDGADRPARGTRVVVTGILHDPYGQLEVRTTAERFATAGSGHLPAPRPIQGASLGEVLEGRLVTLEGVADGGARRSASGDFALDVEAEDGTLVRVVADASSGIDASAFIDGAAYRLTGVVGQRASRKGSLDGYRLWLRGPNDVVVIAAAPSGPAPDDDGGGDTGGGGGSGVGPDGPGLVTIARAVAGGDARDATIEGTVTADARLLDATGRRIVVEDASAAVEVLLPTGASAPSVGYRVRITGTMGRAYGAPRLRAEELDVVGTAAPRQPMAIGSAPGPAHEWRLVRMTGTIGDVKRSGDRWRAEFEIGAGTVPVAGLSGAGIPAASVHEGSQATVIGIVRRPHPSTVDRRFAIVPRSGADLAMGPIAAGAAGGGTGRDGRGDGVGGTTVAGDGGAAAGGGEAGGGAADPASDGVPNADLADLSSQVGRTVRVGGLVVELEADGFRLDDGTSVGRVVLAGTALEYLPLLELGDALNATGTVDDLGDEIALVVEDPAGIVRVGDLAAAIASDRPAASAHARVAATPRGATDWGLADIGMPGVVGLAALVVVSAVSACTALVRRRDGRLRLRARVLARLAAITGGNPTPGAPPSETARPAAAGAPLEGSQSPGAEDLPDARSGATVVTTTSTTGARPVTDPRGV
jgi:hypothetical protein